MPHLPVHYLDLHARQKRLLYRILVVFAGPVTVLNKRIDHRVNPSGPGLVVPRSFHTTHGGSVIRPASTSCPIKRSRPMALRLARRRDAFCNGRIGRVADMAAAANPEYVITESPTERGLEPHSTPPCPRHCRNTAPRHPTCPGRARLLWRIYPGAALRPVNPNRPHEGCRQASPSPVRQPTAPRDRLPSTDAASRRPNSSSGGRSAGHASTGLRQNDVMTTLLIFGSWSDS